MNKEAYKSDTRYEKVFHNMELLGIVDITTNRQHKNGTVVWRLPIKNNHRPTSCIEVASFSTGYVRNQNSGYSNYQLNKRCDSEPEFFDSGKKDSMGRPLYTQWTTRTCKLIPIEIDRLEYLISYCLKNYYIKRANQVVEGKYVSQWYHDWSLERANETYSENTGAMARIELLQSDVDEHVNTVIKLEEKLGNMLFSYEQTLIENKKLKAEKNSKLDEETWEFLQDKIRSLESKLERIQKIADTK